MTLSSAEAAQRDRFALSYQEHQGSIFQQIERSVCGCDYGATSWTTKAEAEQICDQLALRPGQQLLEVGAGAGWPGLYLAGLSGCDLTLIDLPVEALSIALDRAARDQLAGHCQATVSDARALPFCDHGFDAITHCDVLCCLPGKRAVLEECRRVIRGDGQMVFSVIFIPSDIKGADHAQAVEYGPPYIASEQSYDEMIAESGWSVAGSEDVTTEFQHSVEAYITAWELQQAKLIDLLGKAEHDERMARKRAAHTVIANGFVRREIYHLTPA